MDSGLSKKSWILALSADLPSFLPSMMEEESLLLLQTHPSAWALGPTSPWTLPMPAFSVPHSLLAVLLSQTNGSLDLKRTKANLPLILYLLLGTSPSIVFTLQPKFMAFSIKPKLYSSNRQALTVLSQLYLLPFPTSLCCSSCWVPGPLLFHQNLTLDITSPKMPLNHRSG